jgi:hypothetical protein
MNVLEKFNIVPLSQLPKNNLSGQKNDFILPMIIIGVGMIVVGIYVYENIKVIEKGKITNVHEY